MGIEREERYPALVKVPRFPSLNAENKTSFGETRETRYQPRECPPDGEYFHAVERVLFGSRSSRPTDFGGELRRLLLYLLQPGFRYGGWNILSCEERKVSKITIAARAGKDVSFRGVSVRVFFEPVCMYVMDLEYGLVEAGVHLLQDLFTGISLRFVALSRPLLFFVGGLVISFYYLFSRLCMSCRLLRPQSVSHVLFCYLIFFSFPVEAM